MGERINVSATVERFGTKNGYHGPEPTILLRNVRDENGKILTDHIWFTRGKSWAYLVPGDKVSFSARVDSYVKGYQGHRWDVERSQKLDYRLVYPTKVRSKAADERKAAANTSGPVKRPETEAERDARHAAAAANLRKRREAMAA